MAKGIKSLAKDTVIYGGSTIIVKFLNWLLVVLFTYTLPNPAEYGVVTNLYAWTAMLMVILTYGMETGFFRFANKNPEDSNKVYGNALISVGSTSVIFAVFIILFNQPIANALSYPNHPEYIWMLGLSVAMDAFSAIPFAYLRFKNRPYMFAGLKIFYIILYIFLNLFFLLVCPWLMKVAPGSISWFYKPDYGVGYIFVSNIITTTLQTLLLSRFIFKAKFSFDIHLLKSIWGYSLPLLILGITGIANQNLDKMIFPHLQPGEAGKTALGIYGATSKLALVMMLFTQAFRYAYEPFVFAKQKDKNSTQVYADVMKYFIIFSLVIFLGMVLYLDIFKFFLPKDYWVGLSVVPIILWSYIFQGIYFNLSFWYKLIDKTIYGAWFSLVGTAIIVLGNLFFVPRFSYWGSVWAGFVCYFTIMIISYYFGQKYMPIKYDLKTIFKYIGITVALTILSNFIATPYIVLNIALKTILFGGFVYYTVKHDFPLSQLPFISRLKNKIGR
ncbi:MAG: polysaccharide biosynthesis C-terminal domain-containing protein [Paludibacter sp.]|nr:polysaccharide biosynthesis C-terminal domain-containing protein [Paludibacter sp.]